MKWFFSSNSLFELKSYSKLDGTYESIYGVEAQHTLISDFLYDSLGLSVFSSDFPVYIAESGKTATLVGNLGGSANRGPYNYKQGELLFEKQRPINDMLDPDQFNEFINSPEYENACSKIKRCNQLEKADDIRDAYSELYDAYAIYVRGLKIKIPKIKVEDVFLMMWLEKKSEYNGWSRSGIES